MFINKRDASITLYLPLAEKGSAKGPKTYPLSLKWPFLPI